MQILEVRVRELLIEGSGGYRRTVFSIEQPRLMVLADVSGEP
jgi:hypothetical protein